MPVIHANVVLLQNGQIVALAVTRTDGTYQISSSARGRFYVLVSASNFKQITSLSFYAGPQTATRKTWCWSRPTRGRRLSFLPPAPHPRGPGQRCGHARSAAASSANRTDLVDPLRQVPGDFVVRQGEYGGLASLFIRGGNADANQVNLDGVPIGDIGGAFDYSNLSTAGIGRPRGLSRSQQRALRLGCCLPEP